MNPEKIEILIQHCEMGNKSGMQIKYRTKLVIAEKLDELGVDIIEAGFPISSPGDFIRLPKFLKS